VLRAQQQALAIGCHSNLRYSLNLKMVKMRYFKRCNALRFFILLIVIGGLTVFSFLAAFGKDEGTLGDNLFLNFMAKMYFAFRHTFCFGNI
jgi:hypothetical protein